jgi:diphthine synthase
MLYLIGLGLHDEQDLTLRGLEAIRKSDEIYLEGYTSKYNGSLQELERLAGKKITTLTRKELEETPGENILKKDKTNALLILGDPLVATTHTEIILSAHAKNIPVKTIHNASIYSAIGETGLQPYKFGKTITIPYPEGDYFPLSPYDGILENNKAGLHTLCLLDVKADRNRYMSVNEACELLLRMEEEKKDVIISNKTKCVGAARIGGDTIIRYATVEQLKRTQFGGPPHTLIIPGKLHYMEEEMLESFPKD